LLADTGMYVPYFDRTKVDAADTLTHVHKIPLYSRARDFAGYIFIAQA
jgi:hypothetical protein